jgi:hypothetical protein
MVDGLRVDDPCPERLVDSYISPRRVSIRRPSTTTENHLDMSTHLNRAALRTLRNTSTTWQRRAFTTSRSAAMPLYIAHLPDYPNSLERRLSVRQGHLERATKDKEQGTSSESLDPAQQL